jgi:transcriptional regulator NrdR family protein
MSRHRVDDAGEVWWVGYDPEAATYFADRDVDLDNDDYDAPHLPTFADLERAVDGRVALPQVLRSELAAEDPRSAGAAEAEVTARTDQVTAAVRDESQTTTDIQRRVTRVALDALDGTGFALAGSSAIREHGVTDRPTEDVDLFTSNVNIDNFGRSVDQVLEQLRSTGYVVDEGRRPVPFATHQFQKSLLAALHGREHASAKATKVVHHVLAEIQGQRVVQSSQLASSALTSLRSVDDIGYLRWAAVVKGITSVRAFTEEVADLIEHPSPPLLWLSTP